MSAIFCFLFSCGVIHDKEKLINYKSTVVNKTILRLDGYFYHEYESDISAYMYTYKDYIDKTGITKAKTLDALFIYEDGFSYFLQGIDGLSPYSCARGNSVENNTFESAHTNVGLMIDSQTSDIKKVKKLCDFEPHDINRKGLTRIENGKIKIQYYRMEYSNHPLNAYYLYEMNGKIESPETFIITEIKNYRTNSTAQVSLIYKFRQTERKPQIANYFKKNKI